jgi:hypothetical protein
MANRARCGSGVARSFSRARQTVSSVLLLFTEAAVLEATPRRPLHGSFLKLFGPAVGLGDNLD